VPPFYWLAALLLLVAGLWSASTDTLFAKAGGDGQIDYLPSRVLSAQMYKAGALPMWDPHIFSGMSHIAMVQTAPFYPPNIVLYGLLPSTVAFNLSMLLHVLMLLGFCHAFFRLLSASEEAAWLGAVAFSFCGFLLLHIEAIGLFNAATWIPALFYCVEKWIRTLRWKYCALGGVCLAMPVLAGWPQIALLSAIYVAIYALSAWREQPRRLRLFAGLLVTGLIAAGLGASVILPTMEFKQYSNLAALTYGHFISISVAPQSFLMLLFPYLMGADFTTFHPVAYFGAGQMVVTASYMGVLPLMFAAAALCRWRGSRQVRFAAGSVVVASLLSFGGFTALGHLLYRLPVYNFFRDHRVNLIFLAFSVATLAACMAGNLPSLDAKLRTRLSWAIPGGFVALAAVLLIKARATLGSINPQISPLDGLWVNRLHQSMRFGNSDMLIAWATLFLAGLIFLRWVKNPGSNAIGRIAVAFVLADLLWFGLTDQPHFSRGHASPAEQATYETVSQAAHGRPFRTMSLMREQHFLSSNLNEMAGVDDIFGYSALYPSYYTDLLEFSLFGKPGFGELMANNSILSLMNTRFIFASPDDVKTIDRMFDPGAVPGSAQTPAPAPSQNLLSADGWVGLKADQPVEPRDPFRCSRPPCGMQQKTLLLEKNSVYELRLGVRRGARPSADLDVAFAVHDSWRPRQSFSLSNVLLSQQEQPYVRLYVTGDQAEPTDLRFSTNSSAELQLSDVTLTRVASSSLGPNPYRQIANHEGIGVLENLNALPRAFFVPQVTSVAGYTQARSHMWDPVDRFDPRKEALVEGAASIPQNITAGEVNQLAYRPNHARIDVACPSNCFLVLADLYLPGWMATIDGQPARIYRTDAVVRGILVPSGSRRIELTYRPRSVRLGLASMLLTMVVVIMMIARSQ
jgi:hypothetical protein